MGGGEGYVPLYETKEAKGRLVYRLFAGSVLAGICMIWVYRAIHVPSTQRWIWFCMFTSELWFGFYWILTQSARWKPLYHSTFKHRLSQRYEDKVLSGIDIFVCTADPTIEPPVMVANTVLSLMAYDYPSKRLAIYLSDDGGSELTFYALWEASNFAKLWVPFCKKFKVEPRSPSAYFSKSSQLNNRFLDQEWSSIKKLYEEMEGRIETVAKKGHVSGEIRAKHKGYAEWNSVINSRNHQTILQILIDGRDSEGCEVPTLVYLAREKRPQHHHNFKAGALNALIRVSSEISNGPVILTMDCDMYSNNAQTVRDALCFFMDENRGQEIGFVQYPQRFDNMTRNDLYASAFRVAYELELPGLDGFGGPMYIGTGCFFRRESLCGRKYSKDWRQELNQRTQDHALETLEELEDKAKDFANCDYEEGTQWGKEMGLKYGCLVEDVVTGLSIHCNGWRSTYFLPSRSAFLGVAPTTLLQSLVQHKRWMEGHLQIFFSHHCSFIQGHGKINLGLQMGYSIYNLWSVSSIPTTLYVLLPPLCLLHGIPLFPKITSPWFIPFIYVVLAKYGYSLGESFWFKVPLQSWWNEQRIWLYRRTSAYFFAIVDAILKRLGIANSVFTVTAKVAGEDEAIKRYEQEIMEFGATSPMFTMLATFALLNLFCLGGAIIKMVAMGDGFGAIGSLFLQFLLCGSLVLINIPIYQGLFLRKDNGRLPTSIAFISTTLAVLACAIPLQ